MPEDKGFFTGATDALKLAVPLVIQKRRLDSAESRFQQTMTQHKDDLLQKGVEAHDKIQAKLFSDALGKAIETGDEELAVNTMSSFQGKFGGGFEIPDELEGKPQKLTLENILAQSAVDDPEKAIAFKNAIANKTSLQVGEDGSVSFSQGPGASSVPLTSSVKTNLQKKLVASSEGLARLNSIAESYNPVFHEIPTKLGLKWSEIKSKLGVGIPEEDSKLLEEFGVYRQDALNNINLSIKEMTGAQMSNQEAKRLRKGVPDSGEGIFDGDAPQVFQAKLLRKHKELKLVSMRTAYYLKNGVDHKTFQGMVDKDMLMSINEMEKLIDERGEEYEQQLKTQNPNITIAELFSQVKQRLSEEFGMGSK